MSSGLVYRDYDRDDTGKKTITFPGKNTIPGKKYAPGCVVLWCCGAPVLWSFGPLVLWS